MSLQRRQNQQRRADKNQRLHLFHHPHPALRTASLLKLSPRSWHLGGPRQVGPLQGSLIAKLMNRPRQ